MKKTKIYLFTAIGMTAATMIVGAAALLTGCSHDNPTVAPAGWGRIGEPFDSLSRKLELALIGDAGADSIARLAGRFADAAKRDIAKKEARRRAHYWLGRAAARQGDSARSTRELEAALAGPDDSEGEYLRRRITHHGSARRWKTIPGRNGTGICARTRIITAGGMTPSCFMTAILP